MYTYIYIHTYDLYVYVHTYVCMREYSYIRMRTCDYSNSDIVS